MLINYILTQSMDEEANLIFSPSVIRSHRAPCLLGTRRGEAHCVLCKARLTERNEECLVRRHRRITWLDKGQLAWFGWR